MKTLLYIDCCIRREASRTKHAADHLINRLRESGTFTLTTLTLMDEPLQNLSGDFFQAREVLLQAGDLNHRRFDYAHQFANADLIVVAAPFWDLGFPALLKTYIENVSVDGITFYADAIGIHGKSKAQQLIFVTTRGGVYSGSHLEMGSRYMEALTEFFGIPAYTLFMAEGLDAEGVDAAAEMATLLADIDDFVATM